VLKESQVVSSIIHLHRIKYNLHQTYDGKHTPKHVTSVHVLYRAKGQLFPPPDDTNPVVLAHNASSVQWPLDDPARFCRLLYMKNIYFDFNLNYTILIFTQDNDRIACDWPSYRGTMV